MTAQIVQLRPAKPARSKKPRTVYRITERMYLQLKELQDAERENQGLSPWDMSFQAWKGLESRGLIAPYEVKGDWGRWCLTPAGRFAIKLWECA